VGNRVEFFGQWASYGMEIAILVKSFLTRKMEDKPNKRCNIKTTLKLIKKHLNSSKVVSWNKLNLFYNPINNL